MIEPFWRKGLPLLTLVCALAINASAATYYVDGGNASANDSNAGTTSAPWKTITKANQTLVAGDTVFIKQGIYSSYISPVASGASGRPITYQNYSNDVVSVQNAAYGVWLSGKSWITVQGINFTNLDHQMILENSATHNVIAYCNFVGYRNFTTYDGSRIWLQSNYNWIHHCVFGVWGYCSGGVATGGVLEIGYDDGDSTYPGNYNLLEYNTIYDGGHHTLGVHGNHNVIRSNYTYNAAWTAGKGARGLYMNGYAAYCNRNLIEGNKIGYTYVPCDVFGANGAQVSTEWNIFRKNYFYYNNLAALQFSVTDNYHSGPNYNYVYNNTFMDNGWQTDSGQDDPQRAQISFMDWASSFTVVSNVIKNNLFYDAPRLYGYNGTTANNQVFANNYNGDASGNPGFVNATHTQGSPQDASYPNLSVIASSPVINAGGALTTITSASGSGTSFVVADPNYFMDGWGIIQGDQIQLVGTTQRARITSVNYSTRAIMLDTTLNWTQGQGVSLPYEGTAPDIGAFELGSGAPDTNLPPVVSVPSTQSVPFPTTTATLSGYATDPNHDSLTFTWSQVTGPAPVTFSAPNSSNSTATVTVRGVYTLRLTASDGKTTAYADTTVTFSPDPALVTLQAEAGTITAPFTAQNGYISQASLTTDINLGGRATYTFTAPNSGNYIVVGYVNAPDDGANSLWVNIDAEPLDPVSIWDIPFTSGFEARAVSWRGTAGLEFPRIFALSAGTHTLIIRGREAGVQLDRFEIGRSDLSTTTKPPAPTNLRVVSSGS
jgi:hypothetical protein